MNNNKKQIQQFIQQSDENGERLLDILVEVQRRYQLDVRSIKRLLTEEQIEKLRQQEVKNYTIKD